MEMNLERTKIHRLFYVERDQSANNEVYKIAGDLQNMSNVIMALRQLDPTKTQVFCVFGHNVALENFLHSLLSDADLNIKPLFNNFEAMPTIWAIYNDISFVFLLVSSDEASSEKSDYFTVVMQRFLQDMCRNIIICPSESFFLNFSIEHSFHGKPHGTRTYRQVKTELVNIQPPQQVKLDDKNIMKLLLEDQCRNILITNNSQNTYCVQKNFQELNQSGMNNKFIKLKELLHTQIDFNQLSLREVLKQCEENQISLSKTQKLQIENNVSSYNKAFEMERKIAKESAKSLVKELLALENKSGHFSSKSIQIDGNTKNSLYSITADWLINLDWVDERVENFVNQLVVAIYRGRCHQNYNATIAASQIEIFTNEVRRIDKKQKIRQLQQNLIDYICIAVQSENQFEVHFDIHRLHYHPLIDAEHRLQCLTVTNLAPIQFSLNDLNRFMNIFDLSESDRREFSRRIECIACFKTYDGRSEIIVIKRPNITSRRIDPLNGHSVLLFKNGVFTKLADFIISNIHFACSCKPNSQILVFYNYDNGRVTRCSLNEFGQLCVNTPLELHDRSKKPTGVKSLALTVTQDLLILIDANSTVYAINIADENTATMSLLYKTSNNTNQQPNFTADNGELYQTVQTIGERTPIFFFLAISCIDIMDQNYCQIYSIKLNQKSQFYKMQIFTDFIDTYCVLFNAQANEVYCIQNLISDTRIERQESSNNLEKSGKSYIGNQLLDTIRRGEIQFGGPDSLDETKYHFMLTHEYSTYNDRIKKYFKDLGLSAQLQINNEKPNLLNSSLDIEQLCKILISRVPLQLCTIEMGTLVPLNNGKRDRMDHLSSESFRIDMKAREISFSHLDSLLNGIDENENLRIVGIVGRQSTGKSYLLNKIFETRFAVAAGRCTDGIWMSYAFIENIHFIILDCEGLFSDQRTEDEEIKLIAFLAAVCDITILSQDLGFSRFQDRLFTVLSQGVDKIIENDKLFQGILLVAIRDISDSNAAESFDAAEQKFLDLQRRGQSGFLDQLFSNTFKIQLLHHFENRNFDYEIQKLRDLCVKHIIIDPVTGMKLPCRWRKGKDLADCLKILLVQLYTDDFIDSNEIHADMKVSELDEEMKRAWTRFYLSDKQHMEFKEQQIEHEFEGKSYSLTLDHTNLQLDDTTFDKNFENIYDFIMDQLRLTTDFLVQTKEEKNKRLVVLNQLIPEILSYRRQHVRNLILTNFQKKFPNETEAVKERKTKYMNSIEQYMLSFKLQICLKKCTECDLKCVKNALHTEEAKALLEKKKDELIRLQASSKTKNLKNIDNRIQELNKEIITAMKNENELNIQKKKLVAELKYLVDKEQLEIDLNNCGIEMNTKKDEIEKLKITINEIEKQLSYLISNKEELQDKEKLLFNFNNEIEQILNADQYNGDSLKKIIEEFHQSCGTQHQPEDELMCFNLNEEQTNSTDFQFENSSLCKMMNNNITNIDIYSQLIQQYLGKTEEELNAAQILFGDNENRMNEIQEQIKNIEKQKEETTILVQKQKEEHNNAVIQLSGINNEMEILSKKVQEENKSNDTTASSEIEKIQVYIQKLQNKLDNCRSSDINSQSIQQRKNQEVQKLSYFFEQKMKKESALEANKKEIQSLNDNSRIKELEEQIIKDERAMLKLQESIYTVQQMITSIEELNEANQLLETVHSYEEKIASAENRLSKTNKSKKMRENNIAQMKDGQLLDDIEIEEEQLVKLNKTIETIEIELDDIKQQKSSLFDNNILIHKIFNDTQNDVDEQKKRGKDRFDELSKLSKRLNEDICRIKIAICVNEDKLNTQEQELVDLKKTLNDQKGEQENYMKIIQTNKKMNEIGMKLLELLTEISQLLISKLKRLKDIYEAKNLIQQQTLSSSALTSAIDKLTDFDAIHENLTQQLHVTKTSCPTCHYTNAQECKEQYDSIIEKHNSARTHTKILQQELSELDVYSHLKEEIIMLEREAQKNCSCETDHKCSGICQICATEDKTKQNPCMFSAGHHGEHKCDAGHVCAKFCQICEIYGFSNSRCRFPYEHKEPEHHQCERAHQCPATCVCSDPCAIPLELKQHDIHRCNKQGCWKPCMFQCGHLCAAQNHDHDANAELVTIDINDSTNQMKKHLCDQSHYCKGTCNAPGVCKQEYKTQQRTWTTESGQEFTYEHIEVEEVRGKCGIKIPAGKSSHDNIKNHRCDGQHICQERCPDCGSFCKSHHDHDGNHRTLHRNKDRHVFTSTNPTDQIEIRSNDLEDTAVRKYKIGESAQPENCSVSCKRRGRSHFHLVECPGDLKCWEKKLVNKAKHSNEIYYYGSDAPSPKKYDQILCSEYWSQKNWYTPVNIDDKKLIDSCNVYCTNHIERDTNGLIIKDSAKGFCTLNAWHTGDHVFECQAAHHALEMYQGVDICFVIDTTGSMSSYFEKVKKTITRIIQDNQTRLTKIKSKCSFQFAVVDYRDHEPEGDYVYHTCNFTNHTRATAYVTNLKSGSGGDLPEAVLDGLDAACGLEWRDSADHLLFHILDAPPHGKIYHTSTSDRWPGGCPCNKTAQNVLQKMKKKKISYYVLHCSNLVNMMITDFKNYIDVKSLTFDDKITFDDVIAKQVYQQLVDTEMTLKKT